jgi:hypothetical protein
LSRKGFELGDQNSFFSGNLNLLCAASFVNICKRKIGKNVLNVQLFFQLFTKLLYKLSLLDNECKKLCIGTLPKMINSHQFTHPSDSAPQLKSILTIRIIRSLNNFCKIKHFLHDRIAKVVSFPRERLRLSLPLFRSIKNTNFIVSHPIRIFSLNFTF